MGCRVCDVLHHYKWNRYCITWSPWLIIHSLIISNTDKGPFAFIHVCKRGQQRERRKRRNVEVESMLSLSLSSRTQSAYPTHRARGSGTRAHALTHITHPVTHTLNQPREGRMRKNSHAHFSSHRFADIASDIWSLRVSNLASPI